MLAILWLFWTVFNGFFAVYDINHGHNGFGLFHVALFGFCVTMFFFELIKEL